MKSVKLPLLLVLIRLICRRRFGCVFFLALPWLCFYVSSGNETKIVSEISHMRFPPSLPSITHSSFAACAARSACVYIYFLRGWFFFVTAKNGPEMLSDFRYIVFRLLHAHYFVLSHFPSSLCCCSFSSFGTHKNFAKQTRIDLKGRKKAAAAASKKKSIERVSEKLIWPAKNNRQQKSEREIRDLKPVLIKKIYIFICVLNQKRAPKPTNWWWRKRRKIFLFLSPLAFIFFSTSWHDFFFLLLYR